MSAANRDLYGQFFPISVVSNADASTLAEGAHSTGLSVRGGHLWQVHGVAWEPADYPAATAFLEIVISTRKGLTTVPTVADPGVIAKRKFKTAVSTAVGFMAYDFFFREDFLPPIPLVAPNLSMYHKCNINDVNLQSKTHRARILYTTAKVEASDFIEIAEVWAQAE